LQVIFKNDKVFPKSFPPKTRIVERSFLTTILCFKDNPLQYAERPTDQELGGYRFRIGDYRAIFDIEGNDIVVLRAGHRKEIYKKIRISISFLLMTKTADRAGAAVNRSTEGTRTRVRPSGHQASGARTSAGLAHQGDSWRGRRSEGFSADRSTEVFPSSPRPACGLYETCIAPL